MKRIFVVLVLVAALAASLGLVSGCRTTLKEPKMTPKIKPPVIGKAGVLRAAIDLSYPPFGGVDKGVDAGLDLDVAAAVADRLGLKLEVTDAKLDSGLKLLKDRKVDVLLAGLPLDQAIQSDVAFAGTYVNDGPCVFSLTETSVTIESLAGKVVGVQKDSAAYWLLSDQLGEDALTVLPTLRDALDAAATGKVDFAAGDGLVAAYMLRDFPRLRFDGQLASAVPLGVAVSRESADLETAVRGALDDLSAQGILDSLRLKWAGDFPKLQGAADAAESTGSLVPTATPSITLPAAPAVTP